MKWQVVGKYQIKQITSNVMMDEAFDGSSFIRVTAANGDSSLKCAIDSIAMKHLEWMVREMPPHSYEWDMPDHACFLVLRWGKKYRIAHVAKLPDYHIDANININFFIGEDNKSHVEIVFRKISDGQLHWHRAFLQSNDIVDDIVGLVEWVWLRWYPHIDGKQIENIIEMIERDHGEHPMAKGKAMRVISQMLNDVSHNMGWIISNQDVIEHMGYAESKWMRQSAADAAEDFIGLNSPDAVMDVNGN